MGLSLCNVKDHNLSDTDVHGKCRYIILVTDSVYCKGGRNLPREWLEFFPDVKDTCQALAFIVRLVNKILNRSYLWAAD